MTEELSSYLKKYSAHFSGLSNLSCTVVDTVSKKLCCAESFFCSRCSYEKCKKENAHLYGCSEAFRWNGRYIYYCPLGLVFVAASVLDEHGKMVGGLVAGPAVMGDMQDTLSELPQGEMTEYIANLPIFSTCKVNDLSEVMAAAAAYISGVPHNTAPYDQVKLLNTIYDVIDRFPESNIASKQLIESEKKLRSFVTNRDKSGFRSSLNDILGQIYFSSDFDLELIKVRIVELIVVMSRAAIDAGADMNEILLFNEGYIKELERFSTIEELSAWITAIMHRFINYTFDFTQVKHSNVVFKVMEYVKASYNQKITLDDISQYVYLSRAYLSSVFKEETGQSLTGYINCIRVEKSKALLKDSAVSLVDVAGLCGFEDQSYFTKVFKRITGMSPKKYRDGNITE